MIGYIVIAFAVSAIVLFVWKTIGRVRTGTSEAILASR